MFEGPVTGNIPEVLDNGEVTDGTHVTAGQLALALTPYAQVTDLAVNTAASGNNAAAIQSLDDRVTAELASKLDSSALAPAIAPLATAAALATTDGQVSAHGSSIAALQSSLTTGLSNKADQSAFDVLEGVVATKSTPDGVDLKLSNYSTTAAMNGSIASANNATLATVAANYGLKTVVDQHSLDTAARITPLEVDTKVANALLGAVTAAALASELATAGLQGRRQRPDCLRPASALASLLSTVDGLDTPLEVDTKIANALLGLATEAFVAAQLASRDASITALQGAKADATLLASYATNAALSASETTLQSALDAILAELAALQLSGSGGVVNAPAWAGFTTWELVRGSNVVRNLHLGAPLSAALANGDDTLSITADCYSTAGTDAAITAALLAYYTSAQVPHRGSAGRGDGRRHHGRAAGLLHLLTSRRAVGRLPHGERAGHADAGRHHGRAAGLPDGPGAGRVHNQPNHLGAGGVRPHGRLAVKLDGSPQQRLQRGPGHAHRGSERGRLHPDPGIFSSPAATGSARPPTSWCTCPRQTTSTTASWATRAPGPDPGRNPGDRQRGGGGGGHGGFGTAAEARVPRRRGRRRHAGHPGRPWARCCWNQRSPH